MKHYVTDARHPWRLPCCLCYEQLLPSYVASASKVDVDNMCSYSQQQLTFKPSKKVKSLSSCQYAYNHTQIKVLFKTHFFPYMANQYRCISFVSLILRDFANMNLQSRANGWTAVQISSWSFICKQFNSFTVCVTSSSIHSGIWFCSTPISIVWLNWSDSSRWPITSLALHVCVLIHSI